MSKKIVYRCLAIFVTTQEKKLLLQERDDIPNIAFPGYWSLISGQPEQLETPREGSLRELSEEILLTIGESVEFGPITFLGSDERTDLDRTEYIFHVKLLSPSSSVRLTEGKGFGLFTLNECINLDKIAPHHRQYLIQYSGILTKIIEDQSEIIKGGPAMSNKQTIHDYVEIVNLENTKDLESLDNDNSRGFVVVEGDKISALIHTEVEAAFIGHVEFLPNIPRGNHYHLRKIEYMVILRGNLKAKYELLNDPNEVIETVLSTGQLVRILPGCIHTYTAIEEKVVTIEFSPQKYSSADVQYREK